MTVSNLQLLMSKESPAYNRLKEVMDENGTKVTWLANEIGVHRTTIFRWRNNAMQPDAEQIFKLACALKVKPTKLLGRVSCREIKESETKK